MSFQILNHCASLQYLLRITKLSCMINTDLKTKITDVNVVNLH